MLSVGRVIIRQALTGRSARSTPDPSFGNCVWMPKDALSPSIYNDTLWNGLKEQEQGVTRRACEPKLFPSPQNSSPQPCYTHFLKLK